MSSPEEPKASGPDERKLTIIVVPHGELDTRSFIIPYTRLKVIVVAVIAFLVAFAVILALWFPVMTQAARVPGLERELREVEGERARIAELEEMLSEVEAVYDRVREMLGADAPLRDEDAPLLPPLRTAPGAGQRPDTGAAGDGDVTAAIDLWPLAIPGFITRALSDGRSRHPGLDIAVPKNTYIRAAGAGVVRAAGSDEVYGEFVILDHGNGLETVYGHASRLFVTTGDRVRRGEVIALTGSTGRSTAPHLHFEVREDGRPVDPLAYVRQP